MKHKPQYCPNVSVVTQYFVPGERNIVYSTIDYSIYYHRLIEQFIL